MSLPTETVKHESTRPGDTTLVSLAIAVAGDQLPPCTYGSELDRGMAAADLAQAIRCAAPLFTEAERAAFALYLHPESVTR